MRDVGLFVGVASIALDPNWTDRGDAVHDDCWHAFSFEELSQTAQIRREALARIVPKLTIAGRVEVLSLILSKAVLLAADDTITDATIVRQLRSRSRR